MEKLNKEETKWREEYPPKEFRNLSPDEILRWLKQANAFLKKFLKPEDFIRWKEIYAK